MSARVALVLGGGGYVGTAFHAGVLTALMNTGGWDARTAEIIVGTSAGSTSAALLRAGFPPADYVPRVTGSPVSEAAERVLTGIGPVRPAPVRPRWTPRPAAWHLAGRALRRPGSMPVGVLAAALLPAGGIPIDSVSPGFGPLFEQWPAAAMWIPAVSLRTGERVAFGRDRTASVADAVAASCAIPGYFSPVLIDGEPFVDGGAHSAHNADLLLDSGVDAVIVSAPLATADPWPPDVGNAWRLPLRRSLSREVDRLRASGLDVAVIAPDAGLRHLMGINSMALSRRPSVALATWHRVRDLLTTPTGLARIVAAATDGPDPLPG